MIVLQFSSCSDLGSRLIRYFGHGAGFSHVDAVLPDGRLLGARSDRLAGVPPGVQIRPPFYLDGSRPRKIRAELPCDEAMATAFYDLIAAECGKPYDMRAILGFAVNRDWREPGAWFCSELQARMLERAGWFPGDLATPANKVDPDDLALAVSARGAKVGAPLPLYS